MAFEVVLLDGSEHKAQRLAEEGLALFPGSVVKVVPENLVPSNVADHISEGDFVFACVGITNAIKTISNYAVTLRDVTAINGCCDWSNGIVQIHIRRQNKNLTLPFANKYHPEFLAFQTPNHGEFSPSEHVPIKSWPISISTSNMTAALMVTLFHRVLEGNFGKFIPEMGDYHLDAEIGKIFGRVRTE